MKRRILTLEGWTDPRSVRTAWVVWVAFAVAITAALLLSPTTKRTNGAYRAAALAYLHSEPMYRPGPTGFIYPVQSAVVYVPFTFEPRILAEVLWRLVGIAALAWAVWRLARATSPGDGRHVFLLLSAFSIISALGAARNGQINVPIAALAALATAEVIEKRWGGAALWLCLALACKPIAIVFVLLFTALHRPLWWRVANGLIVVAAAPFVHPDSVYVADQCRQGLSKVIEAADGGEGFADLTSLLRLVGADPGAPVMYALRAVAALGTLWCCHAAYRRFDHRTATVLTLTIGAAYLMLFNPRTEGNTYVVLAPGVGVITAWAILGGAAPVRNTALIAACLLLGFAQMLVPHQREHWIRPGLTVVIMGWLVGAVLMARMRTGVPTWATAAVRGPTGDCGRAGNPAEARGSDPWSGTGDGHASAAPR